MLLRLFAGRGTRGGKEVEARHVCSDPYLLEAVAFVAAAAAA
jgi:hypothetical protein